MALFWQTALGLALVAVGVLFVSFAVTLLASTDTAHRGDAGVMLCVVLACLSFAGARVVLGLWT